MSGIAADLAILATFAAILGMFAVSPFTLEGWGIPYLSSGGGVFAKFHPSTFIALAALGLRCLATRHPLQTAWRLATDDTGVVLLCAAIVVTAIVAVCFAKTPVTPLIDTFILPVLVLLLLRDLDPTLLRWMAILLAAILVANAIFALIEFLRPGWRLIALDVPEGVSPDPARTDVPFNWQAEAAIDWRARSLLGHPLVNGLITGAFLLCLAAKGSRWIPVWAAVPVAALQFAAMFGFGARSSLVLTIVLGGALLLHRLTGAIATGDRLGPRALAIVLVGIALAIAGTAILFQTSFFDRMIDRFSQDAGSAAARVTMFDLFWSIPITDLMLGPDQAQVETLQRVFGLEFGIESSWLGLSLSYGIIVTTGIIVGVLAFSRSVVQASGSGAAAILIFYLVLASAAATMSTKTTDFAMTIALILLFLPPTRRRRVAPISGRNDPMEPSWR